MKPNYNDCILNIVSSIKKYHNKDYRYPSNPLLDTVLENNKPKHIILMLLDGLGSNILFKHNDVTKFLNSNKIKDISSVFPPTTAAAIPACVSGKAPIETCWMGWENYVKEVDKHVVYFKNCDYVTGEKVDVEMLDIFPYKPFYEELNVKSFSVGPAFYEDGCKTFRHFVDKLIKINKSNESSFTYAYWDDPDHNLHNCGTQSLVVKKSLKNIDKHLTRLSKKVKDTLIIITADHGHIDSRPILIRQYKDLYDLLERMPGNEGRCTYFNVKVDKHDEFKMLFEKYFSDKYILLTKEEFIKGEYLGLDAYSTKHERVEEMIGDFVGIAISDYYFNYVDEEKPEFVMKSHHAGLTKEELTVPLITYNK